MNTKLKIKLKKVMRVILNRNLQILVKVFLEVQTNRLETNFLKIKHKKNNNNKVIKKKNHIFLNNSKCKITQNL